MRLFILIVLLQITLHTTAQSTTDNNSPHLSFKGVPITGTLEQYTAKMKAAGFKLLSTKDQIAILKGDFAGYKGCTVGVSTLTNKNLVHKIAVIFPEKDTWATLSGNYFNLKTMLTEKYGEPDNVVEEFDTAIEPDDDFSKMHEVKMDGCKYYSTWETSKGQIQLSIDHDSVTNCYVTLLYFDKINGQTIRKEAIDDL